MDILREMLVEAIEKKINIFEYNAEQLTIIKNKILAQEDLHSSEKSYLEVMLEEV